MSPLIPDMIEHLYSRLQRKGYLYRDCVRLVNRDRNVFGALLLELGQGEAMITGTTRHFRQSLEQVRLVLDPAQDHIPFGLHVLVGRNKTVFVADTTVNERPSATELADIAVQTAEIARRMGHDPRVAFLSYSNFGNPPGEWLETSREAVALLDSCSVDFEYEGEMSPDVALNNEMKRYYPFSRLTAPANVLIMPGLQSASISAKLIKELADGDSLGPFLVGMEKPVQIAGMTSTVSDLVTLGVLAAAGIVR